MTTFFEEREGDDRLIICRAGILVHSREIPYCDDDVAINVYRCHKYERPSEPKVYDTCQFLLNFFKQTVLSRFFFCIGALSNCIGKLARQRKETVVSFASHMYEQSSSHAYRTDGNFGNHGDDNSIC